MCDSRKLFFFGYYYYYFYLFIFFLVDWCRHTAFHVRDAASALVDLRLGFVSRTQASYYFGWAALVSASVVALYAGTVNPHRTDVSGRRGRWRGSGENVGVVGAAEESSGAVMWRVLNVVVALALYVVVKKALESPWWWQSLRCFVSCRGSDVGCVDGGGVGSVGVYSWELAL